MHTHPFNPDPIDLFSILSREHPDTLLVLDRPHYVPGCQNAALAVLSSQKCSRTNRRQLSLGYVAEDSRVPPDKIGQDP